MKYSRLTKIINEEIKRLKKEQRNPDVTGAYGQPASSPAPITFTVTPNGGRPEMVGPGHREYSKYMGHVNDVNMEKVSNGPSRAPSGGKENSCVKDHGCCDWSMPAMKYIFEVTVTWRACCWGAGLLSC